MLEYFVHLDQDDPPDDLVLAVAEIPEDLAIERLDPTTLPVHWRESPAPPDLARFGDEFAQRGKRCLLLLPSVLASTENNCLINPAHPDFRKIIVRGSDPLHYDPRMFRKHAVRRQH
jgi:RES domain-containing protein